MTGFNLLFLDVETTGHYALRRVETGETSWSLQQNHEIIELGAVVADPVVREVVQNGEFHIKVAISEVAGRLMDQATEKITHYQARKKAGEWSDAVPLSQAMWLLLDHCVSFGKLVIGNQNFFFDWSFVNVARVVCKISEVEWDKHFHYSMFDTRSMAVQQLWTPGTSFNPSDYSVRLGQLCDSLKIPPEPIPHTALNGARTAFQVWKKLTEMKIPA